MSGPETKTVSATAEVKSRPAASTPPPSRASGAGTVLNYRDVPERMVYLAERTN